ncbi:MAG TPA: hypothetical protein DC058_19935 [Planctomycetaceae bacterium]|nr:hypothetical protein [Planctomycetaceae bacterium]HBC63467.1 hypothetical protein [Planctomycetaceae bacterium]
MARDAWQIGARFRILVMVWCSVTLSPAEAQTVSGAATIPPTAGFQWLSLDPQNRNSACAVLDVDGDGKMDIVCGNHWYQAPSWQRHRVRSVEVIRGRQDDYANLPLDVNGDGRTDLVSANYRSQSLYWIRHPDPSAGLDAEWDRTVVETPGAMETGRLVDIDGDGRLDVLPNGVEFAAWWTLQPGPQQQWQRHALPDELAGHGIGAGDINGDGRTDVVGPHGWAEAPVNPRTDRWVFHAEFTLWRDASIPILVQDVDTDGDADLIWGRGHQSGLYWLEQTGSGEQRTWQRHVIDSSLSQQHTLLWADLDGDGRGELISGSRYYGHDGRDVGESGPLQVSAWRYAADRRVWQRQLLSSNFGVALGVDPKVADVDSDGDLDLVCADRSGLSLLLNPRLQPAGAATVTQSIVQAVQLTAEQLTADSQQYDHANPQVVFRGQLQPLETAADAALRREHTLAGMSLAMGPLPAADRRCPLDMQVQTEEAAGKYRRLRISYQAEPGDRVPAWLLLPDASAAPGAKAGPAMLCLHQTTGIGKGEPAGLGGLPNLHYAHELAERGFVCLVPDYPSFGDYSYDFKTQGSNYASGSMKAIWNNLRAVDLLQTLPEVDPDRIGCIGHSLGGHNTLFTAAFDQRIRAAVTSCGFTGFHDYYGGKLAGWTSDRYMPRIRELYGNDPNRVPFDFAEVLSAIAPRALFVSAPVNDDNFDNAGVRKVMTAVTATWQLYGAPAESVIAEYPQCAHDFPPETRERVYQWLRERLD